MDFLKICSFLRPAQKAPKERLLGGIDYHCHILPGVDDGFQETDESLAMLRLYEEVGITEVWLTPHIMEDVPNETAHLRQVFADFEKAYQQDFQRRNPADKIIDSAEKIIDSAKKIIDSAEKQPLKLHLAAENMLDPLFEKRLRANDVLPLAEKYLLVETSIFAAPMNFLGILERIKNKGYTPVLAHPERYLYMEKSDYERLKSQGIKFQRNLFSLEGQYGDKVKKRCQKLMKWGMYDFVGTDLHRQGVFERYW